MFAYQEVMCSKQWQKPPMTGNSKFIPSIQMVMTKGCFTSMIPFTSGTNPTHSESKMLESWDDGRELPSGNQMWH